MKTADQLIPEIISAEFLMFSAVENAGGRAYCQDDSASFAAMRKGQLSVWPAEVLESCLNDLKEAELSGRNLITEKYARMMEFTYPGEYESIKGYLPALSEKAVKLCDRITRAYVQWNLELAELYPAISLRARPVTSDRDNQRMTSFETYFRCELHTYSENTLALISDFVDGCLSRETNPAEKMLEAIVCQYGYADIAQAEERMRYRGFY